MFRPLVEFVFPSAAALIRVMSNPAVWKDPSVVLVAAELLLVVVGLAVVVVLELFAFRITLILPAAVCVAALVPTAVDMSFAMRVATVSVGNESASGSVVAVTQHFVPVPHEAGQSSLVASPCCACVQ
jgi:hypothetical protein